MARARDHTRRTSSSFREDARPQDRCRIRFQLSEENRIRPAGAEPGSLRDWTMLFEAPRLESGIRTRDRQRIRLLLYRLSYIQKREAVSDRRHTVLQRSRTSEVLESSAIGDH